MDTTKMSGDLLIGIITATLILLAFITIMNVITYPRLDGYPDPSSCPSVSILVPARNEGEIIGESVHAWRSVTYPALEILILDDCSSDGTREKALQAADGDERIRVLMGDPLPEGWTGKNWACNQLAQNARGEILVFTDVDVRWTPPALTALIQEMQRSRADMLTILPTQQTIGFTERLAVPLLGFVILSYLPILAVHHIPWAVFSAANGQCLAFRREVYQALGGHATVQGLILEDMGLARLTKRKGYRLRVADAAGLLTTRMYTNPRGVLDGFAKNILEGHGNHFFMLFLSALFHWIVFLFPFVLLFIKPIEGLILSALVILIRGLTAAFTRQRIVDALLLPISVMFMTLIAMRAFLWHFSGGPRWKGRIYRPHRAG
jgi:chlorobactene glucosyltransferase